MELSKETYTESPHKESDVQSVIKSIMEDTNIVSNNVSIQSQHNPPEKKRRGRPPKNKDNTETSSTPTVKKPRGRPRKQTPTSTPQKKLELELQHELELEQTPQQQQTPQESIEYDTIIPLLQSISSQHSLHHIPDKTLKYVIFLIHLFHHTQPPPPTSPTLTTLIHHTLTHFHPHHLHTTAPHIKHSILHNNNTPTTPTPSHSSISPKESYN